MHCLCCRNRLQLESTPDTVLAPDVAFIARERVGHIKEVSRRCSHLAVEVISPGERQAKIEKKVGQWLQLGARVVWIVNPQTRLVTVYRPDGSVTVLLESDELTGDDLVPGFKISVRDVFNLGNF